MLIIVAGPPTVNPDAYPTSHTVGANMIVMLAAVLTGKAWAGGAGAEAAFGIFATIACVHTPPGSGCRLLNDTDLHIP